MVVGSVKVTTLSRAQPRLRAVVCMTAVMKAIGLNVPLSHSDGGITVRMYVHTYTWTCVCMCKCVCVCVCVCVSEQMNSRAMTYTPRSADHRRS